MTIPPSVSPLFEEYLACFQFLVILNKAPEILACRILCERRFTFYMGKSLGMGLLDYMVRICLNL